MSKKTAKEKKMKKFVWIDLETTGLDRNSKILEVACVVTNSELEEVVEPLNLIVFCSQSEIDKFNDFITKMHSTSGLLEELPLGCLDAEDQLVDYILKNTDGKSPLCGSSIHADRRWLEAQWPKVLQNLHYRNIDISTIMQLAQEWCPENSSHQRVLEIYRSGGHRALADIRASIEIAKCYRDLFLS